MRRKLRFNICPKINHCSLKGIVQKQSVTKVLSGVIWSTSSYRCAYILTFYPPLTDYVYVSSLLIIIVFKHIAVNVCSSNSIFWNYRKDTYRFTFEVNWKEFEQRRTMLSYRSWSKTMQSLVQSQSNGK